MPLTCPAPVVDELRRRKIGRAKLRRLIDDLYGKAMGYAYPWGQVVERRIYNLVVWETVFDGPLGKLHRIGVGLPEIQRVAEELLLRDPCFTPDRWRPSDMVGEFAVLPGGLHSVFTVASHFTVEPEGRAWLHRALEPDNVVDRIAREVASRYY